MPRLQGLGGDYDYSFKFLLVGDADVGKNEILQGLSEAEGELSPYQSKGTDHKTTIFTLDGKRVKLQLWNTSGQGRFCTVLRSYARGVQGIALVYDITNKYSFQGIDRWLTEVNEHAPGVPKVLIGNRLHMAFSRQVSEFAAEQYAQDQTLSHFECSPLCDFNVLEPFAHLAKLALQRNGMGRSLAQRTETEVHTLEELCMRKLVSLVPNYRLDSLQLPTNIRVRLKEYASTNRDQVRINLEKDRWSSLKSPDRARKQILNPLESPSGHKLNKSCTIM